MHAFPTVLPLRIGEKAIQNFGIQIALTLEIGVKAAVRQPDTGHDLSDGHIFESIAIEQTTCAGDDSLLGFKAMAGGIWHSILQRLVRSAHIAYIGPGKYYLDNILCKCSYRVAASSTPSCTMFAALEEIR